LRPQKYGSTCIYMYKIILESYTAIQKRATETNQRLSLSKSPQRKYL
jgi:hypothetical protein